MADKNVQVQNVDEGAIVIEKARTMWEKNRKPVTTITVIIIVVFGGWFAYRSMIAAPKEAKANDAIAKAQAYFAQDSMNLALNGDGLNKGFIKIAKEYSGTDAGNLAGYYAGICYMNLAEYAKAEKYLRDFSTSDVYVKARAYSLLGDALSEQKKWKESVGYYQKAAGLNGTDDKFNAECLFRAGFIYAAQLNDNKTAIDLYKKIKEEYPTAQRAFDIDKYLAQLGETK